MKEQKHIWYAIMMDNDDTDWGTGTYDRDEAISRVEALKQDGYPEAYIAVIDISTDNPVCVEEIR